MTNIMNEGRPNSSALSAAIEQTGQLELEECQQCHGMDTSIIFSKAAHNASV